MAFAVVFYGRNGGCLLLALTLRVLRRAARLQCNVTAKHTFVKARYRGTTTTGCAYITFAADTHP
jgi:hypothetical protein